MKTVALSMEEQPSLSSDYVMHQSDDLTLSLAPPVRVGNIDWCTCGNCVSLPTEEECICCHEIDKIQPFLSKSEKKCICEVRYLSEDLVSRQHLIMLFAFRASYAEEGAYPSVEELQESDFRKIAYRAFTLWVFRRPVGPSSNRPIPSCTVNRIRSYYGQSDSTRLGHIHANCDGNAAEMLDEWLNISFSKFEKKNTSEE